MEDKGYNIQVREDDLRERWNKQSIYKIPVSLTYLKERAYKPQMVSIGPYHHGAERLSTMEEHKRRALAQFLKQSGKRCDDLCEVLSPVLQDLKDAYNQLDEVKWREMDTFLELMITDGCFILELLCTTVPTKAEGQKGKASRTSTSHDRYVKNDPVFSYHGWLNIVPYLRRDMLMLENQIPMTVLQKLYTINPFPESRGGLTKCIVDFLLLPEHHQNPDEIANEPKHLLDFHRKILIHKPPSGQNPNPNGSGKPRNDNIIRSATELHEAGITIKKAQTNSLKDISFKEVSCGCWGAVLRLPLIEVDDAFESEYLNMMAYERFHVGAGNEVTSYIFFMDNIIDSVEDIALLHRGGVIQNALGSDEAAAKLFNSLSRDCTLDPNSDLKKVHWEVSRFCEKRWHRWRAYCCHVYFTNPWVAISVVAAILIFAITIVSAVYSVLQYVRPPKS